VARPETVVSAPGKGRFNGAHGRRPAISTPEETLAAPKVSPRRS